MKDAWKEIINNINTPLNLDYIYKINGLVSRNESLEWGVLRNGKVGISGTEYIPEIPSAEKANEKLNEIFSIKNITLRALKYLLYGMRSQLFWDGNKRTSLIIANKIMIENGKGIITIKENDLLEFNKLLTNFYETNDDTKIIQFLYDKCIFGLE